MTRLGVTAAHGFRAVGVSAGIKESGALDVALVVNDGPHNAAAGVLTTNRVQAAPVLWTQQALDNGRLKAVVLNSGGANACTGPGGYEDASSSARRVATLLKVESEQVAVCSTGLIGERLPIDKLLGGIGAAFTELSTAGGGTAAEAIMTTDTVAKMADVRLGDGTIGGMAKGAGMLAPGLATMLSVITTDFAVAPFMLRKTLGHAVAKTFERIDSDGCMSTNDTVLLLASGATGIRIGAEVSEAAFLAALTDVCDQLSRQLLADAEGASKEIRIDVVNAISETDGVDVARAVARSNLFKCAMHGEDPNWGRVLSAVGTTAAEFEPDELAVWINDVLVAEKGAAAGDRNDVNMSGRAVVVTIDLHAGTESATVWSNDLTASYVHENSAYTS